MANDKDSKVGIQVLPPSGPLTLGEIAREFKDTAPYSISEEKEILWQIDPSLRNQPIKFSDFYGKENTIFIDLTGPHYSINLETLANEAGGQNVDKVVINIRPGARIGSKSSVLPAIRTGQINGNSPTARVYLNIDANASVFGKGGRGGDGGYNGSDGDPGQVGGDAIIIDMAGRLYINNNGVIAGGGGGGGGGGGQVYCKYLTKNQCVNPQRFYGGGGLGGVGNYSGSNGSNNKGTYGGAGGAGGALGQAGSKGGNASSHKYNPVLGDGGAGGNPGYSVRKSSGSVTYTKLGDIRGPRDT